MGKQSEIHYFTVVNQNGRILRRNLRLVGIASLN